MPSRHYVADRSPCAPLEQAPRHRALVLMAILAALVLLKGHLEGGEVPPSLAELRGLSPCELGALYDQGTACALPCGKWRGIALPAGQTKAEQRRADRANRFWLGKEFRPDGTLVNHWHGWRGIVAEVSPSSSWVDGRPAIEMDYRDSSLVWRDIRDEMREIGPGLYLGRMFRCRKDRAELRMFFALVPWDE